MMRVMGSQIRRQDNPHYACIFEPMAMKMLTGLSHQTPQSSESHDACFKELHAHPFPVAGQQGDISEKVILVLWQLLNKYLLTQPWTLNHAEEFEQVIADLLVKRISIWGARKISPSPIYYGAHVNLFNVHLSKEVEKIEGTEDPRTTTPSNSGPAPADRLSAFNFSRTTTPPTSGIISGKRLSAFNFGRTTTPPTSGPAPANRLSAFNFTRTTTPPTSSTISAEKPTADDWRSAFYFGRTTSPPTNGTTPMENPAIPTPKASSSMENSSAATHGHGASSMRCPLCLDNPTARASPIRCPVCLDDHSRITSTGRSLMSTVCGHLFCSACLPACIRSSGRCPTCRTVIRRKDVHPIYI